MTPEREAKIRAHVARQQAAGDSTIGDIYARDLLAELDAARTAAERAEIERAEAVERLVKDLEHGRAIYLMERNDARTARAERDRLRAAMAVTRARQEKEATS